MPSQVDRNGRIRHSKHPIKQAPYCFGCLLGARGQGPGARGALCLIHNQRSEGHFTCHHLEKYGKRKACTRR
jgi:hypothetical protein